MKAIKTLIKNVSVTTVFAIGALQMSACDMSELAGHGAKTLLADGTSLTAQVDGKSWSSDLGAYYIPWKKGVSITGTSGLAQLLTVSVDFQEVGEYQVNEKFPLAITLQDREDFYLARKGVIRITYSGADYIEGEFDGSLDQDGLGKLKSITISNGKFRAKPADKAMKQNN